MSEFNVDIEREDDGRWIGEVAELPGVVEANRVLAALLRIGWSGLDPSDL